jgi:hypothetical protein
MFAKVTKVATSLDKLTTNPASFEKINSMVDVWKHLNPVGSRKNGGNLDL